MHRPIGVFDSGLGGLSVLEHVRGLLPQESFLYLADTKNIPYGTKDNDAIAKLCQSCYHFLYAQNIKALIIACNSASAAALTSLRAISPIPIIGLVPALRPALAQSIGAVGVLATAATLQGALLAQELKRAGATPVFLKAMPELVPWVEAGMPADATYEALLQQVERFVAAGVDRLVLGCTHYPFFAPLLGIHFPSLVCLDSGAAVARRTQDVLAQAGLLQYNDAPLGDVHYYTSGPAHRATLIGSRLLGRNVTFVSCVLKGVDA